MRKAGEEMKGKVERNGLRNTAQNNAIVTNNGSESLVDCTIENQDSRRYTPSHLKKKEVRKNSLMIIQALYKKGLINAETLSNIEKKYGRLDG